MIQRMAVVVLVAWLGVPVSAHAQSMTSRSPSRVAGWLGVAAAGGALLFYARPCGVVGSLGKPVTVYAGHYWGWSRATISGSDLVPFSDNGACGIDFSVNGRLGSRTETLQYATLDVTERMLADLVRGTAAGQPRWRHEILMPALGLIGLGIVGAVGLSDVPVVRDLRIGAAPGRVQVGRTFGW